MKFVINHESVTGELGFGEIFISPNEKNGYRPFELFLSSLAGCSGTLLKNILVKKRYSFHGMELEVSAARNPDEANRIEEISITAYVRAEKPLSPEQSEQIAHLVVKNCGMIQTIIGAVTITFTIKSLLS